MYTVYAADSDNEMLNYIDDYDTLLAAKRALNKEIRERQGDGHGKIVDESGQTVYKKGV